MSRLPDLARASAVALMLLLSPLASADSGLLNGSLGRWLDTEVLPELGKTLGQHPRFKGETIKLVSLNAGQPTDRASRLHEAVEAHLTQRLLKASGVRIAWTDQPQNRCGVAEQAEYLLGVEIEADGSYYHRLNIRMIDVNESVWVSGVSHSWRGRLTATEAAAFTQAITASTAGSVDSPIPIQSGNQIAEILHQHLRCAHPQGLDGTVFLVHGDDAGLNRIMASLRTELATTPVAAITRHEADADWVLSIQTEPAGTGNRVQQIGLLLTEQYGSTTQQVATVYVTGKNRPQAYAAEQIARTPYVATGTLLSDLSLHPSADNGICDTRKARGNQCAEVSFDLLTPAYLFVLSSYSRKLSSTSCEQTLVEASAGERRFRIRVPPSVGDLPDAGVYAIAVNDRTAAKKLARHIRTGVCSRPLAETAPWLDELDAIMSGNPGAIQWRAIHLSHTSDGVERL